MISLLNLLIRSKYILESMIVLAYKMRGCGVRVCGCRQLLLCTRPANYSMQRLALRLAQRLHLHTHTPT